MLTATLPRLCGMMKAQDIQFDGVRMYMWCLKILASHRRSFFFEGSCRPPQVVQLGVSHRRSCFLKDRVVHLKLSRLVSGSERDLVAYVGW